MDKPKLFFCYSKRLKRALEANGYRHICIGLNERTGDKFWLFWFEEIEHYKDYVYQSERDKF